MGKIAELRKKAHLTQRELAEESGLNIRHIQKFESGEYRIEAAELATAISVAKALGVSVYDLVD